MTRVLADNPITEDFSDSQGRWLNYDAYDIDQRTALAAQQHVDLGSFENKSTIKANPFYTNDTWTSVTNTFFIGPRGAYNNWSGILVSCVAGNNIFTVTYDNPVDLDTGFDDNSVISLACPAFPSASVDLTNSYMKLYSGPGGTITTTVPLSASVSSISSGDTEIRLPRPLFNAAALDEITQVDFNIYATANCSFRLVGARLLAPGWTYAPLDINTQSKRLINPPMLTGAVGRVYSFPTYDAVSSLVPDDFPIMVRAANPSGGLDPRPVNLTLQCAFYTGSKLQQNHIRLFLREFPEALVTQLDLDGETQDSLNALGFQPDYTDGTIASYAPRKQSDLDGLTMAQLDNRLQSDLERYPNQLFATWQEVRLEWGVGGDSITIQDTEGNNYYFETGSSNSFALSANTLYYAIASLEDNTLRVRVYTLVSTVVNGHPVTALGNIVFDTGDINDDGLFIRRRGRVAWYASLVDGDAYITEIRSRKATFAEYKSHPMAAITPVDGLQLFAAYSPDKELFTGFEGVGSSVVSAESIKSSSGRAWKIVNPGNTAGATGAISNIFELHNPSDTTLSFQMNFPADSVTNPPQVQLLYVGDKPIDEVGLDTDPASYTFTLPTFTPDVWQSFKLDLSEAKSALPSGKYVVAFSQASGPGAASTTWYLDTVSISEAVVVWHGRPEKADAWGHVESDWTNFKDVVNSTTKGVLFSTRGLSPQVRAQARSQAATISKVQVVPRYATLGRLVWTEDALPVTAAPVPTITTSSSTLTHGMTFSGSATPTTGNHDVLYYWSFGDGQIVVGKRVVHAFPQAADYAVTLTVVDDKGNRGTAFTTVTIT